LDKAVFVTKFDYSKVFLVWERRAFTVCGLSILFFDSFPTHFFMKRFYSVTTRLLLAWLCFSGFAAAAQQTADTYVRPYTEPFQFGANMGYHGTNWNDESLAGLLHQAGGHSLRPSLPEWLVEYYGYNARLSTFDSYVNTLGMTELSCFIGDPVPSHRDFTVHPGCSQPSKMFAHMYEPIWNPDGSVNQNNYYAYYLYQLLQVYGDKVRFWEVMNEPDFANGASATPWLTRAPTAAEQANTQAPFYYYIRMLRISYEVIKKYHPEAYVTVGAGYTEYVDALMRYTDEPTTGAVTTQYPAKGGAYFDVVSYHAYPNYFLHYWDNAINGFRYTRTSDYAANKVIELKNDMQAVLTKYHYDGTLHPAKYITLNESNVARRNSEDRTGTDEMQRNFGIKALVLTQKNDVKQFYYFGLAEMIDAPATTANVSWGDEISLMGLYENIANATPATAKLVQAGKAFSTTSQLIYGYKYDATRTAALNLPANVDGGAFSKNGDYVYVLWAKALIDNLEQATAPYSFPATLGLTGVQRYEWDYSQTNTKVNVLPQALVLTESPSFFKAAATTPPVATCTATGTLLREQWDNVNGSSVSDIVLAATPSSSVALTSFEQINNTGYNYGARLRGYICAPQTGAYTFYVAGDDAAELWLSTDADPANAVRIATCAQWIASTHDFYRYASQRSASINLTAGTRYYIEARHKQAWGAGFVSVAWRLPSGVAQEPIPGAQLSPFVPVTVVTPPAATCSATGSLLREQWTGVSGSAITDVPLNATVSSSTSLTQLEAFDTYGFNYGARLRGYVCPPQSGAYTFYVAGDDAAELWLSTDADPANAVRIATCNSWLASPHDFYRYASQQSASINLTAGTRYYIEARHKQAWGAGFVAVAWRLPSGVAQEPIPGAQLSPFGATVANRGTNGSSQPATGVSSSATELTVYPNPFTQQATVQFDLAKAGSVSLAIYDLQGKLVRQLYKGEGEAGVSQRFTVEAQGLSSGLYMLRLVTAQNVLTQKLMLTK
jgi:hypothetical protein